MLGRTSHGEQVLQRHDRVPSGERPGHLDCQTLPCELTSHHEAPQLPAVVRPLREEVVAPHMIPMRRPVTDAPIGTRPRYSAAFSLLLRHLHVRLLPDPMHPLEVHLPASERFWAGQHTMRALAPMPRERLHDLPYHPEQLAVAVYLPGTVPLRAPIRAWSATSFFSLEFSF